MESVYLRFLFWQCEKCTLSFRLKMAFGFRVLLAISHFLCVHLHDNFNICCINATKIDCDTNDFYCCECIHVENKPSQTTYRNKVNSISGEDACSATRIGLALPQLSIGTSINLDTNEKYTIFKMITKTFCHFKDQKRKTHCE